MQSFYSGLDFGGFGNFLLLVSAELLQLRQAGWGSLVLLPQMWSWAQVRVLAGRLKDWRNSWPSTASRCLPNQGEAFSLLLRNKPTTITNTTCTVAIALCTWWAVPGFLQIWSLEMRPNTILMVWESLQYFLCKVSQRRAHCHDGWAGGGRGLHQWQLSFWKFLPS